MRDLQLLSILETLVKMAKSGALPSAVVTTITVTQGVQAREELAKLDNAIAVQALHEKLKKLSGGILTPPIVGEGARLLESYKWAAWLMEIGRLAKERA